MEMTTAIILGYIGVALMVGLSGAASCIGTSIAGQASVGAMKKNGGAFGSYMILSAIPGSQGLYGFVSYFIIKGFLTESITMLQGAAIFGAGLLTGFVCLFSAYYQARICANGIAAIGNGHDVMGKTLILAAFPELYAILTVAGFRATVLSVHSLFLWSPGVPARFVRDRNSGVFTRRPDSRFRFAAEVAASGRTLPDKSGAPIGRCVARRVSPACRYATCRNPCLV